MTEEQCPSCNTKMSTYNLNNEPLKICDNETCPQQTKNIIFPTLEKGLDQNNFIPEIVSLNSLDSVIPKKKRKITPRPSRAAITSKTTVQSSTRPPGVQSNYKVYVTLS